MIGALVRIVHDQIDAQIAILAQPFVLRYGRRLGHGLAPSRAERFIGALFEQRISPNDANREQLNQRIVGESGEFALPDEVAGIGGPAADVEQRLIEVFFDRARGNPDPFDDRGDRGAGFLGKFIDECAETCDAHDLGVAIVAHRRAPRGIGSQSARRQSPCRLAIIEIRRAPF